MNNFDLELMVKKVVGTIVEYTVLFKEGIPYSVLSRKYGKKFNQQNIDLEAVLIDLKNRGFLKIYMNRQGSKIVTPSDDSGLNIPQDYRIVS